MRPKWIVILLLLVASLVGAFWWQQSSRTTKAEQDAEQAKFDAGLASARVISAAFEKVADLRVGVLRGTAISRAQYDGVFFNSIQMTRAPFTADYYLDLRRLPVGAYRWDEATRTMHVRMPMITMSQPNIDMTKAEVKQEGVWISAKAGRELQRQAAIRLRLAASEASKRPEFFKQAQESARDSLTSLVRTPLQAAGLRNVNVEIRFGGEVNDERWDTSTPLAEILANRQ